jgi:hypothetical protein
MSKIDDLLYQAGLTADGVELGPYEKDAVERLVRLTVKECADFVQFYYKDLSCEDIAKNMKTYFGVR